MLAEQREDRCVCSSSASMGLGEAERVACKPWAGGDGAKSCGFLVLRSAPPAECRYHVSLGWDVSVLNSACPYWKVEGACCCRLLSRLGLHEKHVVPAATSMDTAVTVSSMCPV